MNERHENSVIQWADVDKKLWRIELSPDRIVLRAPNTSIELPQAAWVRDVHVTPHGERVIIRIETFDSVVRFVIPADQAASFLEHIQPPSDPPAPSESAQSSTSETDRLLWPKVSAIAVWALALSSLTFIPGIGLLAAVATTVLLVFHRSRVRRAAAWRHSRVLCGVAIAFMLTGLAVSTLALLCTNPLLDVQRPLSDSTAAVGTRSDGNWGVLAGGLFVLLLSLSVHEAAHALSAWWLGDGLARSLGRVTLNPLSHIDPFGTVLLPLLMVTAGGPVFGYARPVPVQVESLPRYRRAHVLISLAGPGSNVLLAAASLMLLLALGCIVRLWLPSATVANFSTPDFRVQVEAAGFALAPVFGPLCTLLKLSFVINVFLALFNLIPIPPLDGSWVLEHLSPPNVGRVMAAIRPYGFLVFVAAIYLGLFRWLIIPVSMVLAPSFAMLYGVTGL